MRERPGGTRREVLWQAVAREARIDLRAGEDLVREAVQLRRGCAAAHEVQRTWWLNAHAGPKKRQAEGGLSVWAAPHLLPAAGATASHLLDR